MKIVNREVLRQFSEKTRCEMCGRLCPQGCDAAHVFSRGAGRLDISINLIALCRGFDKNGWVSCHQDHHSGKLTQYDLLAIVSRREKVLQDAIIEVVYFLRALPKYVTEYGFQTFLRHWNFSGSGKALALKTWGELCQQN